MANNKVVRGIRDGLVIVAAILMIAVVVFQWMEIQQFELQSVIGSRLAELFASEEVAETPATDEAQPAANPGEVPPGAPGAPGAPVPPGPMPGVRGAVDAKNNAQAEAGL